MSASTLNVATLRQYVPAEHAARVASILEHFRESGRVVSIRAERGGSMLVRLSGGVFRRVLGARDYSAAVRSAARWACAGGMGVPVVVDVGPLSWCWDHAADCACVDCRELLGAAPV